jgi:N-acetylmuramoyl-L-alanine amidase
MPTPQKQAVIALIKDILTRYPGLAIKGHRGLNATLCPGRHYPFDEIVSAATGTPILGQAQATVAQAQAWAMSRKAADAFVNLAPLYWQEAPMRGGVRPEVAYAQAAKETAFGRFGGVIPGPQWHNWCGLKTTQGGGNYDVNAHAKFPDDLTGVRAHLDHLALYAGAPGYPLPGTPDPRHFPYIAGTAKTVEDLSGKWAGIGYGESIVKDYLTGLLATPEPVADTKIEQLRLENRLLREHRDALLERIERAKAALTEP